MYSLEVHSPKTHARLIKMDKKYKLTFEVNFVQVAYRSILAHFCPFKIHIQFVTREIIACVKLPEPVLEITSADNER